MNAPNSEEKDMKCNFQYWRKKKMKMTNDNDNSSLVFFFFSPISNENESISNDAKLRPTAKTKKKTELIEFFVVFFSLSFSFFVHWRYSWTVLYALYHRHVIICTLRKMDESWIDHQRHNCLIEIIQHKLIKLHKWLSQPPNSWTASKNIR